MVEGRERKRLNKEIVSVEVGSMRGKEGTKQNCSIELNEERKCVS